MASIASAVAIISAMYQSECVQSPRYSCLSSCYRAMLTRRIIWPGKGKSEGLEYPQAVAVTDASVSGFYVIYSVNKEDIWVAKLPYAGW